MTLSDDKINELSHRIASALEGDSRAAFTGSFNSLRLAVRRSLGKAMQQEAKARRSAEEKIRNQKKTIPEGSAEWDALYWRYYEEEVGRLRSIG